MARYHSVSTATMSPGRSTLPVGRASATSRPCVVVARLRVHRRSSQVSASVSRSLPRRDSSVTVTLGTVITTIVGMRPSTPHWHELEEDVALGHRGNGVGIGGRHL